MGDRVYLNIRFHKQDAEIVADCLGFESGIGVLEHVSEESDGGSVWLVVEQANYGLHEERAELAAKDVAFEGYHCTGGEYGPCVFCAIDGKMIEADAVESSVVTLVVLMDEDTGDFYADSLAAAQSTFVRFERCGRISGIRLRWSPPRTPQASASHLAMSMHATRCERAVGLLDMKPGRYFVGVWFVSGGERQMDWMATLFRDPGETRWTMRSRFRYYDPASRDPHDGTDERSNYEGSIEGSDKEVMAKIDYVANALVTASGM